MLYGTMVRAAFTFPSVRHPTFPWFICTQANEQKRVFMQNEKRSWITYKRSQLTACFCSSSCNVGKRKGRKEKQDRLISI